MVQVGGGVWGLGCGRYGAALAFLEFRVLWISGLSALGRKFFLDVGVAGQASTWGLCRKAFDHTGDQGDYVSFFVLEASESNIMCKCLQQNRGISTLVV